MQELTTVETVHEDGSWLFTVRDQYGECKEAILVPCDDTVEHSSTSSPPQADDTVEHSSTSSPPQADNGVEAWINRCTHEAQRFDTGRGVPMRDGRIICPRHGSMFDSCSGDCDNGEAAGTTLSSVEITVDSGDGTIYLSDDDLTFVGPGGIDDNDADSEDDGPASTSHIGF